jgi:hypothetical protein
VKHKIEPTFDPLPAQAPEDEGRPGGGGAGSKGPLRHVRIPSWRAAGAGAAGWIALACVAVLAALPDVAEEVVVGLSKPPPTIQDVDVTGSIVAAGRTPPAPAKAASFTMALGKGPSADRLWLRWTNLSARNASLLRDVPPTVKPLAAEPETFVLLAGLYIDENGAREACRAMQARFISCDAATLDGTVVPEPR